ncbi:TPA: hypothetical protein ACH3X2_004845 [Trebouxia sp. C0005]
MLLTQARSQLQQEDVSGPSLAFSAVSAASHAHQAWLLLPVQPTSGAIRLSAKHAMYLRNRKNIIFQSPVVFANMTGRCHSSQPITCACKHLHTSPCRLQQL